MDITFLIDASGSVGTANFNIEKEFVRNVLRELNFEFRAICAVVIAYSDLAEIAVTFDQSSNFKNFDKALDLIKYVGRTSRIDKALCKANSVIFNYKRGMRRNVAKIIVLVTDGRQSSAPDALPLREAAFSLRRKGIGVLAVGVGEGIDMTELKEITSSHSLVTRVRTFDQLLAATKQVSEKVCEMAGKSFNLSLSSF